MDSSWDPEPTLSLEELKFDLEDWKDVGPWLKSELLLEPSTDVLTDRLELKDVQIQEAVRYDCMWSSGCFSQTKQRSSDLKDDNNDNNNNSNINVACVVQKSQASLDHCYNFSGPPTPPQSSDDDVCPSRNTHKIQRSVDATDSNIQETNVL